MSHSSMRTSLASFACTNTEYALTPKLALVSVGEGGRTCRREHQRRSQGRVVGPRSEQLDVERKRVRVYKLGEMTEMSAGRLRPGSLQLSPSNSIVGQSVTILSFLAGAWLRLARLYMLNSVRLELLDI
jgi:hypothetical protein